jgi:YfiH family protein
MADIHYFNLDFDKGNGKYAIFPFVAGGNAIKGISCCISSSIAGDMKHGGQNPDRLSLFAELGLNPDKVYGLNQVHSRVVLAVGRDDPPMTEADGMVTRDKDISLSVTVADCLPVFLFDARTGTFGVLHSGWKGTGIAERAICLLKERWGTEPKDIAAVLGPCIGSCCYQVDAQRAASFEKEFGAESVRKSGGSFFIDLKTANIKILLNAGIQKIAVCNDCTFTDERLGSYRREGQGYTRMIALASAFEEYYHEPSRTNTNRREDSTTNNHE